ncbi:MAG: hypothetical protein ACLFVT_04530 [Syntrophobacteria bacterium]
MRANNQKPAENGPMKRKLDSGAQALVDRILALYNSGLTLEEIVDRIFTTDTKTAAFRMEALIQIVIDWSNRCAPVKRQNVR